MEYQGNRQDLGWIQALDFLLNFPWMYSTKTGKSPIPILTHMLILANVQHDARNYVFMFKGGKGAECWFQVSMAPPGPYLVVS